METKPGYSEVVPNYYPATIKKVTVIPTDDGGQEYQVVMVIPRNSVTRDLGDFVGQPVRVDIKSVQGRLLEKPQETVTAPITAQSTRPPMVIEEATGEVPDSSVTLSARGRSVTLRGQDFHNAANAIEEGQT